MAIRYLKIILVAFVSLLCILYASQNVANLRVAHGFVTATFGMQGNTLYPDAFGPAINSPALAWLALAIIIVLEYAAGLLAAKGAWDLFTARGRPAVEFNRAKTFAFLGCGMGLVVWFGLFSAFAGPYFQIWQTPAGAGALQGAFQYATQIGIVLLFVGTEDD